MVPNISLSRCLDSFLPRSHTWRERKETPILMPNIPFWILISLRRRWQSLPFQTLALSLAASLVACTGVGDRATFSLSETSLTIPQVDYEPAVFTEPGNPYPQLDRSAVNYDSIVQKQHNAVVLENDYVTLTLLPEMGRVYSLVPKATGNEVFWHNDTVTVGGGSNPNGWWIWIGGAEYTLPGWEHGTTWAERWGYEVLRDNDSIKTVRMSVTERGTGLEETLDISLFASRSYYEASIAITNPTADTVLFAHWINPQWTPGGRNELTDNTEFIIPTESILIPERFRDNLGESPQDWETSALRFISGWDGGWGDLMADGIEHGFYGAYSHDFDEGVIRVFDKDINPGVDIWTYGFKPRSPRGIPMGSGKENDGYVEMWGGTSKLYPDERRPIAPGESIAWTEWMYALHGTGGLSYANEDVALCVDANGENSEMTVGFFATSRLSDVHATVTAVADTLLSEVFSVSPDDPLRRTIVLPAGVARASIVLEWEGETLAEYEFER